MGALPSQLTAFADRGRHVPDLVPERPVGLPLLRDLRPQRLVGALQAQHLHAQLVLAHATRVSTLLGRNVVLATALPVLGRLRLLQPPPLPAVAGLLRALNLIVVAFFFLLVLLVPVVCSCSIACWQLLVLLYDAILRRRRGPAATLLFT